jgi:hypothetical protein
MNIVLHHAGACLIYKNVILIKIVLSPTTAGVVYMDKQELPKGITLRWNQGSRETQLVLTSEGVSKSTLDKIVEISNTRRKSRKIYRHVRKAHLGHDGKVYLEISPCNNWTPEDQIADTKRAVTKTVCIKCVRKSSRREQYVNYQPAYSR